MPIGLKLMPKTGGVENPGRIRGVAATGQGAICAQAAVLATVT